MTGILRAGEANIWSSALVDSLFDNLKDEVCWKSIYEAFFVQLAWDNPQTSSTHPVHTIMERATKQADQCKRRTAYNISSFDEEAQKTPMGRAWVRISSWISKAATLTRLSRRCPYHARQDRRLLYDSLLGHRPLLCKSIMLPEKFSTDALLNPLRDPRSIWKENLRPIWLLEKRPCMAIFGDQLMAFCLAFGINLEDKGDHHFSGSGAFGLVINASREDNILKVELKQTRRASYLTPAKGSGYSPLYAKLMACACLPFACTARWMKSILVNGDVLDAIKRGDSIIDADTALSTDCARDYLDQLPRQFNNDLFYAAGADEGKPYGTIRNEHGDPLDIARPGYWDWPKAVAGIACGGFVPRAAIYLVEAVRFTILGSAELAAADTMDLLEGIERLINAVDEWEADLEIFGSYVTRRREATHEHTRVVLARTPITVADAGAVFGRYTTLLERLLAEVRLQPSPAKPVLKQLHEDLCDLLRNSYQLAVDEERVHMAEPAAAAGLVAMAPRAKPNHALDTYKYLGDLKRGNITVQTCGKVAQLLILAWTYQVGLINWHKNAPVHPLATYAEGGAAGAIELMPLEKIDEGPGALGL